MKLKYDKEQKGFWLDSFEESEVQKGTYAEFLLELADLCTSPKGVCPRWHLRERTILIDGDGDEWEKDDLCIQAGDIEVVEQKNVFELWSWGTNGNNPYKVNVFNEGNEAEDHLLSCYEQEVENEDQRPTQFYTSLEELKSIELEERD